MVTLHDLDFAGVQSNPKSQYKTKNNTCNSVFSSSLNHNQVKTDAKNIFVNTCSSCGAFN